MECNRESWLHAAMPALKQLFGEQDYSVPEVRVSIGFPSRSALGKKSRRIGECWADQAATDKVHHIFLSPVLLAGETQTRVLDVLVHELVHAVVGIQNQHNAHFGKCARSVGLTGKMTATTANEELTARLEKIVNAIGPCPGGGINPSTLTREKQTTRMRKYVCPECKQIVRAAADGLNIVCGDCDTPYVQEEK